MDNPTTKRLPNNLRSLRQVAEKTLEEVALAAGTTPTQVSRLEKGARSLTPEWQRKLSAAIGVPISRIVVFEDSSGEELIVSDADIPNVSGMDLDADLLEVCFLNLDFAAREANVPIPPLEAYRLALILHESFLLIYKDGGMTKSLIASLRKLAEKILP